MAAAMAVTYVSTLTLTETLGTGVPALAANQTTVQSGFNTSLSLNGSSSPAVQKGVCLNQVITAGAATIDLTSLVGAGGGAVSLSGSKGRFIRAKAPATNGAAITLSKGASNGFTGLGASFSVALPPGAEFTFYDGGNGTAVSGTVKTLDLAGTGSTDSLNFEVVGGT